MNPGQEFESRNNEDRWNMNILVTGLLEDTIGHSNSVYMCVALCALPCSKTETF